VDSPSLLGPWAFEPLQLIPTVVAAALYLRRTRTLARRGQPVSTWKQVSFWTGIALVVPRHPADEFGEGALFFTPDAAARDHRDLARPASSRV
jgi:hypothetical protein